MKKALKLLAVFVACFAWMPAHADSNTEQLWAMNFVDASERVDAAKHNGYPMASAEKMLMKVPQLHVEGNDAKASQYLSAAKAMADWYLNRPPSPFFE